METLDLNARFKNAPWVTNKDISVVIGGAGGIGSWLVLFLARAGFKPIIIDYDTIEYQNVGGQLYKTSDVGKKKIIALHNTVKEFVGIDIMGFDEKITKISNKKTHFMFGAFDNMDARKDMFELWKTTHVDTTVMPLLIDGRLEMEQLQIFCVTPENMDDYEKNHLFDSSEVESVSCTMKQTTHVAAIIAGLMVSFFTNHIANIEEQINSRSVPYYYEMFTPMALVEIKEKHDSQINLDNQPVLSKPVVTQDLLTEYEELTGQ